MAQGTQAIDRAAQLLVHVVESRRPLAVGELAETTGLPKSTTSRLVGALERQGLLQRLGDRGAVRPGPALLRFAQRSVPEESLLELSAAALERLAAESGETINLAIPTPLGVDHLAQRDSPYFVGVANWVGRRVPTHCTANGKVFLAWGAMPVPARLERLTDRTIVEPKRLDAELAGVRSRGFATAVDELELGLSALAAPVFGPQGEALAALSISGPSARLTSDRIAQLAPLLIDEANTLAERLGHRDHTRGAA